MRCSLLFLVVVIAIVNDIVSRSSSAPMQVEELYRTMSEKSDSLPTLALKQHGTKQYLASVKSHVWIGDARASCMHYGCVRHHCFAAGASLLLSELLSSAVLLPMTGLRVIMFMCSLPVCGGWRRWVNNAGRQLDLILPPQEDILSIHLDSLPATQYWSTQCSGHTLVTWCTDMHATYLQHQYM